MPPLALTNGYKGRPRLQIPAVRAVNMLSEQTPGGPEGGVRFTRPGLDLQYTIGDGPILRAYSELGLFNGDPFFVSGANIYRKNTLLGAAAYGQFPRIAAAQEQIAFVCGGALFIYNGSTFEEQQFFDDGVSRLPPFSTVAVLYNIFLYAVAGTQQFFFSEVGNPGVINAANFSAAQVNPSIIREFGVVGEELYIFKEQDNVEIWDYTGQLTAPFQESAGRTYAKGCAAQNSVQVLDNALFWCGDDFSIYRTSTVPQKISSPLIDDILREAGSVGVSQMTCFTVGTEGHAVYVFNLPLSNQSFGYDCQSKEWFQWGTQDGYDAGPGVFTGAVTCGVADETYVGDRSNGNVYLFSTETFTDNGTPLQAVIAGALWLTEGIQRCNNVTLHVAARGQVSQSIGAPTVGMRYSDDGGETWTQWIYKTLFPVGGTRYKVRWGNCGPIRQPGKLFEFFISSPISFSVTGAAYNTARR